MSGSGSILNLRVSHFTQLAMSSVVQACGSTGTTTGVPGSLSVSESRFGIGDGGELLAASGRGNCSGAGRRELRPLELLLSLLEQLLVSESESEDVLVLLLLLQRRRRRRGRAAASSAAGEASSAVAAAVVVVVALGDAPTPLGRASWCMALKVDTCTGHLSMARLGLTLW